MNRKEAEALAAEAARALRELDELEAKYGTEPPQDSVIAFQISYRETNDDVYSYVGLRVGHNWYLTGSSSRRRMFEWYDLLTWLETKTVHNFRVVTQDAFHLG